MARSRLLRGALLAAAWLTLFITCLYLFFPVARINALIDRELAAQGLRLTPAAHKTLLPGLAWDNALLSSGQGGLVHFDRMLTRPLLLHLLSGRFVIGSTAAVGPGRITLESGLSGSQELQLEIAGLELKDVPLFKTVLDATRIGGRLKGQGTAARGVRGWNGELRLEINRLEFSGVRIGSFTMPEAAGLNAKALVRLTDGRARLESFTLEGEGVYMRLAGEIPFGVTALASPLNLVLEIMPKPDFLENQKLVFMMLARFSVSPGVYRLPITGTLLKPQIM